MPDFLQQAFSTVPAHALARLMLAALLGGVIGLERKLKHRPAGLRDDVYLLRRCHVYPAFHRALSRIRHNAHCIADYSGHWIYWCWFQSACARAGERSDDGGDAFCGGIGRNGGGRRALCDCNVRYAGGTAGVIYAGTD